MTNKADVEMKEGGKYELFWTPQDPDLTNNSAYGCKILAIERPYYLNIEWRGNADQKEKEANSREYIDTASKKPFIQKCYLYSK